jgi:hypothetical protein
MSAAQEHPVPISIDDDVELLTEQIEALKALGEQDEVGENRIYDFSIRWGTALAGRLPRLVHYSSLGLLDEPDESRFRALCTELRGLSNLIARFKLAQPDFTDSPPAKAKRHRVPRQTAPPRELFHRR